MSKMELPSDIAEKVVGMLNTKDIPRAVLVFDARSVCFYLRGDACTREELEALGFHQDSRLIKTKALNVPSDVKDARLVPCALALGFEFPTDDDKSKFAKCESFVMHRAPAAREFA